MSSCDGRKLSEAALNERLRPAVTVRHGHRPQSAGRALSREQEWEVQRLIRDHDPDQLKMNYALWTRQAVGELIARRFEIRLAVRAVGEYLK